jgi:hypothetical protein
VSHRPSSLGPASAVVALLVALSHPCAAADAEEIYVAAVAAMKQGDYAIACPRFAEARRLKPDATPALMGLALCLDKRGATASAWSKYRELTMELKTQGDSARAQAAADRAEELSKILSTVVIRVDVSDTPGLILRLDKEDVPKVMLGAKMNVDPGPHVLEASAPGFQVWQTTFTIGAKNDAQEVRVPGLVAKPSDAGAPPGGFVWGPRRVAGIVVAGVGVTGGVILGAVFGAQAVSKNTAANAQCSPKEPSLCNATGVTLRQDEKTDGTVSTVAWVAGGVLVAGGLALFFTASSGQAPDKAGVAVVPSVGRSEAGLRMTGRW